MWLKPSGFRTLHVLTDLPNLGRIHAVVGKSTFFEKILAVFPVSQIVDDLVKSGFHVGPVAVPYGLDQQVTQFLFAKKLAEDVENASAERLSFLLDLFEQPFINVALARLLGQQVPEMADLSLPDAVDAAEPLFQAVWVPRQVVVHHQMRAL